ncbi:hypothetical protein ACFE04_022237 [Oxalis oulophora]
MIGGMVKEVMIGQEETGETASTTTTTTTTSGGETSSVYGDDHHQFNQHGYNQQAVGLQPELFFKMSHEIYNYGEGLIGKVAADHSHKWIYKEPNDDQEINFLSAWHNSPDSHPRTWEAQFQSGIKTIALIAVREGVVQLGAVHKVIEDLSYVVVLRKKLSYIESIPGVLLPHPSSSAYPSFKVDSYGSPLLQDGATWHNYQNPTPPPAELFYHDHFNNQPIKITPSMSSLEALLSKLPSVVPPGYCEMQQSVQFRAPMDLMTVAKEEMHMDHHESEQQDHGESSSASMIAYHRHHQQMNVSTGNRPSNGY